MAFVDLLCVGAYDSLQRAKGEYSLMANHAVGQDALVGQTLGHYRIIEKIGTGGMGEAYRARDEHLDREVAINVLPLEPS